MNEWRERPQVFLPWQTSENGRNSCPKKSEANRVRGILVEDQIVAMICVAITTGAIRTVIVIVAVNVTATAIIGNISIIHIVFCVIVNSY